jgi:hypothetical protein
MALLGAMAEMMYFEIASPAALLAAPTIAL